VGIRTLGNCPWYYKRPDKPFLRPQQTRE
jgi:hypothetical protein